MISSRTNRARRARIAVALLGTVASLALPSLATAGGITVVPEPAAFYEADSPYNRGGLSIGRIEIWGTVTCRPTNPMVQWCRYTSRGHDGTARELGPNGYDDYIFGANTNSAAAGESKRVVLAGVDPQDDTVVEGHETLTYDVEAEGMLGQVPMEKTVSAPAQITIWNDDYRPGQAPNPTAPKKTTCWTCR
jgi:hypothetical protein